MKRRHKMAEIIQTEESTKLYEYNYPKPELEDIIQHFNPNHDPSNGQFTFGFGSGGVGSISRKRRKALKKARKIRAKNLKIRTMEKQTKEDIIKRKDIKSMLSNVDKFTNQEINDMLNRLDVERRLAEKVKEFERSKTPAVKKIWRGAKESAKEGVVKGGKQVIKTASTNAVKMASKQLLKQMGGDPNSEEGKKWNEMIDKLLREEKK